MARQFLKITYLILSNEAIAEGNYTLWNGETQLAGSKGEGRMGGFGGGMMGQRPEMPEGGTGADGTQRPEGGTGADGTQRPEGGQGMPDGDRPRGRGDRGQMEDVEVSTEFVVEAGGSYFSYVGAEDNAE